MRVKYISLLILIGFFSCGGNSSGSTGSGEEPTLDPEDPVLVAPANNAPCEGDDDVSGNQKYVNFTWNTSKNTDSYLLTITDLENNQIVVSKNLSTNESKEVLTQGKPYSWKVVSSKKGVDSQGESSTWKFYVAGEGTTNYIPFPASLTSPKDGASVTAHGGKVTLTWEEGGDPDNDVVVYTLYFDEVDGKQNPTPANTNLTSKSLSVDVTSGKTYYWSVKSSDAKDSSFSPVYSFTVH